MTKPTLPPSNRSQRKRNAMVPRSGTGSTGLKKRPRRSRENNDVLVSAVLSTYLLTHLHHVLQRAEFGAAEKGRQSQAANFAQLRKLLCMDARSMKDASAVGMRDGDLDQFFDQAIESEVA